MLDDKPAIVAQASSPVSICLARSQLRRKAPLGGPLANQEFDILSGFSLLPGPRSLFDVFEFPFSTPVATLLNEDAGPLEFGAIAEDAGAMEVDIG